MSRFIVRFIFAFCLAVAAAVLNYIWMLYKAPNMDVYVTYSENITQGYVITEEQLCPIQLPSKWDDHGANKSVYVKTLVPWADRFLLVDLKAVRDIKAGELAQQSDITVVDVLPEYDVLGPFRLISVGNRFVTSMEGGSESGYSSSDSAITVAVKHDTVDKNSNSGFDDKTRRLVQIIESEKNRDSKEQEKNRSVRFISVVAWPAANASIFVTQNNTGPTVGSGSKITEVSQAVSLGLAPGELALVVPLPNLETIPEVLLRESSPQIGFVVPSTAVNALSRNQSQ